MTVAEAIREFVRSRRRATRAEIVAGVFEGTPASRSKKVQAMLDRGDLRCWRRRDDNGHLIRYYGVVDDREWCEADQLLVDEYEKREREAMVFRRCLCCRESFITSQAYRLCEPCRSGEIFSPPQYPVPEFAEAA